MGNIQDCQQVKACNTQWLRELFSFLTETGRMQEPKCGGKHIAGPNHHHPELGESQNGLERWFVGFVVCFFFPSCLFVLFPFKQLVQIYIYQDKQVPHALSLSGINSSEPAACLTCLEILMEFQEPLAMNCLCFSIKIKKHLLTVPMAKEQK